MPVSLRQAQTDWSKPFSSWVILRQAQDDFSFGKLRMTSFGRPALSKAEGPALSPSVNSGQAKPKGQG
ncbi:MAG: hypothetical protein D6778_02470 [Nitrospirae bacterium]|nr:MAG: hypothetical protein D6778_02470 [Nitrospirota bacterium]